ncbi:agamous-like MADS-box protein AGL80 [Senna tora]|uniref:Agamous-like MADS-box protein AGL80 n=1 Tax=Senna tora TaxID=362788 RepID=A0A834TE20_9FABA|nr:agamous-like MADS-box protein AGL80 [Senna tora]
MGRQKVKLEYITDDLKRKASFRKRKENVVKKTNELNILCDVDAAAIIYSGRSADSNPKVWPDDGGVHRFLDKYHGRSVSEKTLNQEGLIHQRLHKEKEHLKKRSNENKEEEISQLMINYMGRYADPTMVSENALRLKMLVEQNLKEIDRVMEASGKEDEVPSCWNNMEDLEYYMGFGSSEMPPAFQNDNYQNASSSINPFYP